MIMFLFHRCEYLLQEKGQDFVHQIQARFPRLFEQVSTKQWSNVCFFLVETFGVEQVI